MAIEEKPQPIYTKPADDSLESYKAWITDMTLALGGTMESDITPEEWELGWRGYWGNTVELARGRAGVRHRAHRPWRASAFPEN